MPKAFHVFAVDSFPAGEPIRTEVQLTLLSDEEENAEITATTLARSAVQEIARLVRFDVEHDFLFRLEYPGRARGKVFREFITPYKFPAFLGSDSAIGFRPLIVRTKKKVATDFFHRLNGYVDGFAARSVVLDFDLLRPRLQSIQGAWFGSMRQPNLATTAVFGHHVDLSDEFRHAEDFGDLRNLLVELEQDGITHTVMVSADGGIVLYNAYQTEGEELGVVDAALNGILRGCMQPRPTTRGPRRSDAT